MCRADGARGSGFARCDRRIGVVGSLRRGAKRWRLARVTPASQRLARDLGSLCPNRGGPLRTPCWRGRRWGDTKHERKRAVAWLLHQTGAVVPREQGPSTRARPRYVDRRLAVDERRALVGRADGARRFGASARGSGRPRQGSGRPSPPSRPRDRHRRLELREQVDLRPSASVPIPRPPGRLSWLWPTPGRAAIWPTMPLGTCSKHCRA